MRTLIQLKHANLKIIMPEERIDSYALMESCEKIVTFGSTIGIEATYWGKPSVLLGACTYDNLDCCYTPKDRFDAVELIISPLKPKPKENCYPYAYLFLR